MSEIEQTVQEIATSGSWPERIQAVRRIPERHGRQDQPKVYAAVAGQLYRPHLSPEFAFVPERPEYEIEAFSRTYRLVHDATRGFSNSGIDRIAAVLEAHPEVRDCAGRVFTLQTLPQMLEVEPFPDLASGDRG